MYRTNEATRARCPRCDANALTAPTKLETGEGNARLVFSYTSGGHYEVLLNRGRVCLSCGHVELSVGQKGLEELNRELADLVVVPDLT